MALGGAVGQNLGGWVFGLTATVMVGGPVRLYAAHSEQVLRLPDGAQVLGGNAECAIGAYGIGGKVLCTQYHPEMTPKFAAALVQEYRPKLPAKVGAAAKASLSQSADMAWIAKLSAGSMTIGARCRFPPAEQRFSFEKSVLRREFSSSLNFRRKFGAL